MGRLPVIQFREGLDKRDKLEGITTPMVSACGWQAGDEKGYIHGQTDEFSHYAVEDVVTTMIG